jgi:hypothetical protein
MDLNISRQGAMSKSPGHAKSALGPTEGWKLQLNDSQAFVS